MLSLLFNCYFILFYVIAFALSLATFLEGSLSLGLLIFIVFVSSCCTPHWGGVLRFSSVQPTQCTPLLFVHVDTLGASLLPPIFSFLRCFFTCTTTNTHCFPLHLHIPTSFINKGCGPAIPSRIFGDLHI